MSTTELRVFTPKNGVYTGVNTAQFTQIEYLAKIASKMNRPVPHLGLFGEASTGKTTTVSLLNEGLGTLLFSFTATSSLTPDKINSKIVETLKEKNKEFKRDYIKDPTTKAWVSLTRNCILFIDEAHELSKEFQTHLLTILDRKGGVPFLEDTTKETFHTVSFTFIFATTDSSKLLYPLTTRLHSIVFDQYSREDVCEMIKLKYKNISDEGIVILANCSKLVPRVALRLAEQLNFSFPGSKMITKETTQTFVKQFLNMEENGIDAVDKRILLYLANHKKKIEPVDLVAQTILGERKEKLEGKTKLTDAEHKELNTIKFKLAVIEQKINTAEFTPKSRQDISLACRVLDLKDLEVRLTFLEKLNLVVKTAKGIMLDEQYL